MDDLTLDGITAALRTNRLGHALEVTARTGSTNNDARARAGAGAPDGLVIVADEQTHGRGRLDRSWWAPPGTCLLFSILLRPDLPLARAGQLTMCLGLGAVEGIEAVSGLRAGLKWPNDLVHDGRKLGGMLSELHATGERVDYAVLGLGLNVNLEFAAGAAPADVRETATSLSAALSGPVDRVALLAALLERTEFWYERLLRGESPHLAWAERLDTLGRTVEVVLGGERVAGTAAGVTPEGGLLLRIPTGETRTVWSGDVTRLRPGAG